MHCSITDALKSGFIVGLPFSYTVLISMNAINWARDEKKFSSPVKFSIGYGTFLSLSALICLPLCTRFGIHSLRSLLPALATASLFSDCLYKKHLYQLINHPNKLSKSLIAGIIYSTLYCEHIGRHDHAMIVGVLGTLIALGMRKPKRKIKNYYTTNKNTTRIKNKFTSSSMTPLCDSHYFSQTDN